MATQQQRTWNYYPNDVPARRPPGWHAPKLTGTQRAEIARRLADGEKPAALALEYGVTARTIRNQRTT